MPTGTHTSPIQQTEADISAFINSFANSAIHTRRGIAMPYGNKRRPHYIPQEKLAFLTGMEAAQNATIRRAFEKWPDTLEFFALRVNIPKAFTKSFQRGLERGLQEGLGDNRIDEKKGDLHNLVGSCLPTSGLRALTSTKNYGAYKAVHKDTYNRVLLRVLTNPPTEEAIREHLFLGTILTALTGETRYFPTLWRSARLVYDFMHTPARQLQKQALKLL